MIPLILIGEEKTYVCSFRTEREEKFSREPQYHVKKVSVTTARRIEVCGNQMLTVLFVSVPGVRRPRQGLGLEELYDYIRKQRGLGEAPRASKSSWTQRISHRCKTARRRLGLQVRESMRKHQSAFMVDDFYTVCLPDRLSIVSISLFIFFVRL